MSAIKLLERVIAQCEKSGASYALAGGLAASLYREQPRLTTDVDILLSSEDLKKTKELAKGILTKLGLTPSLGWIAGNKNPVALVIDQSEKSDFKATIDFLLPTLPWVDSALDRAKNHKVDFGFAKIPTVTVEDLILAKVYALKLEPERFKDLDDLQSIFKAEGELDYAYLIASLERLSLSFPKALKKCLPIQLRRP